MPSTFTPDLVHLSVQAGPDQSKPRHLCSQHPHHTNTHTHTHTHTLSLTRNATVCSSRASANPRPWCGVGFESHKSRYGIGGCDSICPAYKHPQRLLHKPEPATLCWRSCFSNVATYEYTALGNPVKKINITSPGPYLQMQGWFIKEQIERKSIHRKSFCLKRLLPYIVQCTLHPLVFYWTWMRMNDGVK